MLHSRHTVAISSVDERIHCRFLKQGCKYSQNVAIPIRSNESSQKKRNSSLGRLRAHESSECHFRPCRVQSQLIRLPSVGAKVLVQANPPLPATTLIRLASPLSQDFHMMQRSDDVLGSSTARFSAASATANALLSKRVATAAAHHQVSATVVSETDTETETETSSPPPLSPPMDERGEREGGGCPRSLHHEARITATTTNLKQRAEELVREQMELLRRDLADRTVCPDKSSWLNAVWLLHLTLPRMPRQLATPIERFLSDWRDHVKAMRVGFDQVDWHMFHAVYPEEAACAATETCVTGSESQTTTPLTAIDALAASVDRLYKHVVSVSVMAPSGRKNDTPCIQWAQELARKAHHCCLLLMRECLAWMYHRTSTSSIKSAHDRIISHFCALTQQVWKPMHEHRMLTVWLHQAKCCSKDTQQALEHAVESLLYLVTHCVYGMNSWGSQPQQLDAQGREAIGLSILAKLLSDREVRTWLQYTQRAELVAECINVFHAAGMPEDAHSMWDILLDLGTNESRPSPSSASVETSKRRVPLLYLGGISLTGTARVHLVNCLLLALQDFYTFDAARPQHVACTSGAKRCRAQREEEMVSLLIDEHASPAKRARARGPLNKVGDVGNNRRATDGSPSPAHSPAPAPSPTPAGELLLSTSARQFHHPLFEAVDSTTLFAAREWQQLRQRLEDDGFLLLRSVIHPDRLEPVHAKFEQQQQAAGEWLNKRKTRSKRSTTNRNHEDRLQKELKRVLSPEDIASLCTPTASLNQLFTQMFVKKTDEAGAAVGESHASHSPNPTSVAMLPQYTWPRGKPRGTSTHEHADYSFFQHESSFFSDFHTAPSTTTTSGRVDKHMAQECMLCLKRTNPQPSPADRSPPDANALQCNICKRMCHVACLQKAEALSVGSFESRELFDLRTSGHTHRKWHCKTCANKPIDMWTCWIPLVNLGIQNTITEVVGAVGLVLLGNASA
jgi:hypothetical protein